MPASRAIAKCVCRALLALWNAGRKDAALAGVVSSVLYGIACASDTGAAASGAAAAPADESTEFDVTLEACPDDKKIAVIKVVREITGLGLKEAKELCESTPKELKKAAAKAEAEEIKKKVEAAGGKVALKGV